MPRHRYGASRPPRAAVLLLLPAVVLLALVVGLSAGPVAAAPASSAGPVLAQPVARPALPQPGRSRRAGLPVAVAVVALVGSASLLARVVREDRERTLRDRAAQVARDRHPRP